MFSIYASPGTAEPGRRRFPLLGSGASRAMSLSVAASVAQEEAPAALSRDGGRMPLGALGALVVSWSYSLAFTAAEVASWITPSR
jgi:hypothetical protein